MVSVAEKTDEQLVTLARECFDSIYVVDCYGVGDCVLYDAVCQELSRRGYEVNDDDGLRIEKPEEEE